MFWGEPQANSPEEYYAVTAFRKQLGRYPTAQELAQAVPFYRGADKNIQNVSGGDAYVSQMAQQIQAKQPDQTQQTADQAAQQEQQNLQAQLKNFLPELQSGFLDPLQKAIAQQGQNQTGLMNQAIGGVQGLTQQGTDSVNNAIQQAMQGQKGINQDQMSQLQGINSGQTDILKQLMGSQTDDLMRQLTDPSAGSKGQQMQNYYNRLGLLDSGAFNQGLATQFGNLAGQQNQEILGNQINQQNALQNATNQGASSLSGLQSQGLGDVTGVQQAGLGSMLGLTGQNYGTQSQLGLGGLNAQQNVLQMPVTQALNQFGIQQGQGLNLQNLLTGKMFDQNDFNQQSTLGQLLANQGQPSTLQKDLGMASGAAQGAGGLAQGAGALAATSYVCKELIKRGLLCEMDMDDFHAHIMPAMFKKGRAFWKYAMDGKNLVDAVNAKGLDWKVFKPLLFDRVMEESDPIKAVDLYADACHQLCISADRSLWDGRVYRSDFLDSLPFLPMLLTYTPFLKALWKCLRIKTLIIYDRPRCNHGIR